MFDALESAVGIAGHKVKFDLSLFLPSSTVTVVHFPTCRQDAPCGWLVAERWSVSASITISYVQPLCDARPIAAVLRRMLASDPEITSYLHPPRLAMANHAQETIAASRAGAGGELSSVKCWLSPVIGQSNTRGGCRTAGQGFGRQFCYARRALAIADSHPASGGFAAPTQRSSQLDPGPVGDDLNQAILSGLEPVGGINQLMGS